MKMGKILFLSIISMLAMACASSPGEIPMELTAAELVQRAQEASDKNRYNISLEYYETLLDRFQDDIEYVCTGEYEIAFIHYKQKKYDIAKIEFNSLLVRYDTPDEELLPPQFKILSHKILGNIQEIESRKNKNKPTEGV
jgi:outer membrane protein assembly factor BamD (BamD/ComL family)